MPKNDGTIPAKRLPHVDYDKATPNEALATKLRVYARIIDSQPPDSYDNRVPGATNDLRRGAGPFRHTSFTIVTSILTHYPPEYGGRSQKSEQQCRQGRSIILIHTPNPEKRGLLHKGPGSLACDILIQEGSILPHYTVWSVRGCNHSPMHGLVQATA